MKTTLPFALVLCLPVAAWADRFEDWDKNGDGSLQKEELPEGARRNFERVDANGDGVISREEEQKFAGRGRTAPDGIRVLRDLDYGGNGNVRQSLDLFVPRVKSEQPRPLIVWIHGGAWRQGSKDGGMRNLKGFVETGNYVGASLNYRLTNEARWPAQIHDCNAAIRWLKAHAEEYGYDPDRIGVWGASAGGHLVAMLGVAGDVPALEGELGGHREEDSAVACVVDYFGPTNLETMVDHPSRMDHAAADSPEALLLGGAIAEKKEAAKSASPMTHVSKGDAPFLIVHGTKDDLVPYPQSVEFRRALEEVGVPVQLISMEGAGHGFRSEELSRRVEAFFERELLGHPGKVSSEAIPLGR